MKEQQILDDFRSNSKEKNNTVKTTILLLVLWSGMVLSILLERGLGWQEIISVICLFLGTVLYFGKRELGVEILMWILLLAIFGVLSFFPFYVRIGVDLPNVFIGIDLLMGLVLVVFSYLNKQDLSEHIQSYFNRRENRNTASQFRTDKFVKKFSSYDNSRLAGIIDSTSYVKEAKRAAEILLKKREESKE